VKIAAHIGLKDEVELVERAIEQLYAVGVDQVVVTDMGSTDGSLALLRARTDTHRFRLFESDDSEESGLREWTARSTRLMRETGCDWAVFIDADELMLPREGDLRRILEHATADVLRVDRFNVPLTDEGLDHLPQPLPPSFYDQLPLVVDPVPDFQLQVDADPPVPWSRGVPNPKVIVRMDRIHEVTVGGHDVTAPEGREVHRERPADILIAHLAFTTRSRFDTKMANIVASLANNKVFFEGIAWHWKRWAAAWERGTIGEEYQRQVFTPELMRQLREEGAVQTAQQWFERRARESSAA
jgi:hypothetical protein